MDSLPVISIALGNLHITHESPNTESSDISSRLKWKLGHPGTWPPPWGLCPWILLPALCFPIFLFVPK